MHRSLSVGTRWALFYTFVTSIALTVPIGFIYVSVTRQIKHDAWLLLDSYMAEVRTELESHSETSELAVRKFTARLRRIAPELDYGVARYAGDGSPIFQLGSLVGAELSPIPARESARFPQQHVRHLRNGRAAYLVMTTSIPGGFLMAAVSNGTFAASVG
jgi:hypothetical protein